MPEGYFIEKHSYPSIKILPCRPAESNGGSSCLRNVRKSPQQLIHAVPQAVQAGAQIVHVGRINTSGLIGASGILVQVIGADTKEPYHFLDVAHIQVDDITAVSYTHLTLPTIGG